MDILIKSFNRVFYLDRCIASIYKFIKGNFTITVMDDGTPEKYLIKIQEKYPNIRIVKSKNYVAKSNAIKENLKTGKEINGFEIPSDLWIKTVKQASPYFIITEDDVWFTEKINIDQLQEEMIKNDISLLKLGWLGNNSSLKEFDTHLVNAEITAITPQLFTAPRFIMNLFFYNKFKFFSLLYKLGCVDNYTKPKYWVLNSIMMGIYKKEYWLYIWKNANTLDEKKQLVNASVYYRKYKKNKNFITHLNKEVMKTTFISSSSNSYHIYKDNFDVNQFNYIFNEKWFYDEFDSLQNFPKDFSEKYISDTLDKIQNKKASTPEWKKWIQKFKTQYRNLGCSVDDN